jgi:spore maturation protein CgeB
MAPVLTTSIAEKCPMCGSGSSQGICTRPHIGRQWTLARCDECQLHFTAPVPSAADLVAFYQGGYHSALRTAEGTEKAFASKYQRYVDALERHLPSGRVVDIGCSTGLLVRKLRDRGYEAEGIELNEDSAAWGRANYGVVIHSEPLERCPYEPGSLDAIFFTDVLEHMQHPRDFLREASERLASGGVALVTFPDVWSVESRYQYVLSRLFQRDWLWSNCHIPLHVWEFTHATAVACFRSAGFQVVEFRRSQPEHEPGDSLALAVLNAPLYPLSWPMVGRRLGSQMEFVIRKN